MKTLAGSKHARLMIIVCILFLLSLVSLWYFKAHAEYEPVEIVPSLCQGENYYPGCHADGLALDSTSKHLIVGNQIVSAILGFASLGLLIRYLYANSKNAGSPSPKSRG